MKKITILCLLFSTTFWAIAQKSEETQRFINRGDAAYSLGHYTNALDEYAEAGKLSPNNPSIWYGMGKICETIQGEYYWEQAAKYYEKYANLIPKEKEIINEKIDSLRFLIDNSKKNNSFSGVWISTEKRRAYSGKPYCMIEVTSFEDMHRIRLLSKSIIHSNSLIREIYDGELYNGKDLYFLLVKISEKEPVDLSFLTQMVASVASATLGAVGADIGGIEGAALDGTARGIENAGNESGKKKKEKKIIIETFLFKVNKNNNDNLEGICFHRVLKKTGESEKETINTITEMTFVKHKAFYQQKTYRVKVEAGGYKSKYKR